MKSFLVLAILSTVVCVSVSASAATLYVDGAVPASGDGTTWETALKTVQGGIDAASDGDPIIVAQGTYVENIRFRGKITILTSTDPLDPTVVANTIIDGNQAGPVVTFAGNENQSTILSGFTIRNGKANEGGGIIGNSWLGITGAMIENNLITANSATYGGGLSMCAGMIQNNTIANNSAGQYGGGLDMCGGTIQNNTITGNSAGSQGGGLARCSGTIQNNLIAGNSAVHGGGIGHCNHIIRNCTITENLASHEGGGLHFCISATIINSTIWGNRAPQYPQLSTSSEPTYSCIQDWTSGGEGNITNIPRFVRSGYWDDSVTPFVWMEGDYHLLRESPCIDAGKNQDWMWDAVDLDGNPRLYPGVSPWATDFVDMGAYEYIPPLFEYMSSVRRAGDAIQVVWTSQPGVLYAVQSCTDLLAGVWTEEASFASNGATTFWSEVPTTERKKFYRVEMK